MPDYRMLGRNLFELGHGNVMDDTADKFYAMDIEQQIDVKELLAGSGSLTAPDSLGLSDLGASFSSLQCPVIQRLSRRGRRPVPNKATQAVPNLRARTHTCSP